MIAKLILFGFCSLVGATAFASAASAADCSATASAPWTQSGKSIVAEAKSSGPKCDSAKIDLVLRGPDGKTLLTFSGTSDSIMSFVEAKSQGAMKKALAGWIADAMTAMPTSDKLPDWKDKQEQPSDGEFAFYPEEGVKRPAYLATRKARRPMFCFVQGMESYSCAVLGSDGAMTTLGAQSFPG